VGTAFGCSRIGSNLRLAEISVGSAVIHVRRSFGRPGGAPLQPDGPAARQYADFIATTVEDEIFVRQVQPAAPLRRHGQTITRQASAGVAGNGF